MTTIPMPIRVLLVDDSELVRMGLRTLLAPQSGVAIMGEANSVASAVALAEQQDSDVILMDIRLPDGTGFDACRQILERQPGARVIFLTSVVDDQLIDKAIHSGGHGYLLKEINGDRLVQAIRDAAVGKSILDPAVTDRVLKLARSGPSGGSPLEQLSAQETRVLELVARGKTNKEIAMDLALSEKTVRNYLANVFDKLRVTRRAEAAALYTKHKASG